MSKPTVYAIDFGTSNSLLAASDGQTVTPPIPLDPLAFDPTILRSLLYFPSMSEVYFGQKAIEEFTARDLTGRFLRSVKKFLPMRSFIGTFVDERPLNLEDIVGRFLLEMRTRANKHFDTDVDSVILGRPARFSSDDDADKYAEYRLDRAARIAGFKNIEFCPEPVAAAREFRASLKEEKTVFVGDFGGGTSDFTVVKLGPQPYSPNDVLAVGGIAIAGDALDGAVMRSRIAPHFGSEVEYRVPLGSNTLKMPAHLMERICSPADISVLRRQDTMQFFRNVQQWALDGGDRKRMDNLFALLNDQLGFRVFEEIEKTKRALSKQPKTLFDFRYPGIKIEEEVWREQYDGYITPNVDRVLNEVDATLARAGLKPSQIDILCCTGGTANVPLIQEGLASRFGADKLRQHKNFHSVVEGLAERAREVAAS